jgi:hypothetical protein
MTIQSRTAKIARLAFHNQQARAEQTLMRRTAGARAELGLIKEAFGTDGVSASVSSSLKTLARLEQASAVREKAIAKVSAQLTPAERALADTMSKRPGKTSWMKALIGMKDDLVAPPTKETRSAVGKLLRDDLAKGRSAPFDPKEETAKALKTMQGYTLLTRVWATLENAPKLLDNFQKTRKFNYADVVWVSKQTGIEVDRVKGIMDKLAKVAPERPYPLETTLFQRKDPNAFSAGGGQFGIHDEMLRLAKTDDELAYLMGHELAHDVHRDVGAHRLIQARTAAWQKQATADGVPKATRERVQGLFDEQAANMRRIIESQADADGLRYAARAGYDPKLGAEFMSKIDPQPGADKLYLKAGYPPTRKRVQAMKDLIEQGRL